MNSSTRATRTVAVIPARGGSKGVPGKNLRTVAGRSLVARAVAASLAAACVDEVVVSTDDDQIAAAAVLAGASVVRRPAVLAGDAASSESALLHALEALDAEGAAPVGVLAFVQATSPFLDPADLDRGIALVVSGAAEVAFATTETHEFLWRADEHGYVSGLNHDAATRPRRQDRRPDHRETGAFYVLDATGFRAARHRFFGRVRPVPTAPFAALEIDTESDLVLAEAVAPVVEPAPTCAAALDVDVVITDFDGVHTDDSVAVDQHGTETVRVSRRDGLGVSRLRAAGVPLVIVSKERNPVVGARAAKLGVEVLQGVDDKQAAIARLMSRDHLDPERVAYLGNDVNDLPAMAVVGWPVAVPEAHPDVLRRARLVLTRRGGQGAVRELCDLVIAGRGR